MTLRHVLPLLSLSLLPGVALAHPGHLDNGLVAGLLHPLTGVDHLLAMLAIGIWAALQPRAMKVALPATFLLALMAGFAMGVMGAGLPMVETGIALSVLLLGLMIASAVQLPRLAVIALAAVFAVFHGYAHGTEFTGGLLAFASGFFISSLVLHVSGAIAATQLDRRLPLLARALGAGIAASGALMMI